MLAGWLRVLYLYLYLYLFFHQSSHLLFIPSILSYQSTNQTKRRQRVSQLQVEGGWWYLRYTDWLETFQLKLESIVSKKNKKTSDSVERSEKGETAASP